MAEPKTAIVTGSSRGIGAAIAERLALDGMAVAINYSGGPDEADQLVQKITAAGGRAMAAKADVSDPAAVANMFDAVASAYGGIDVLVNNAGIMKLKCVAESDNTRYSTSTSPST